jgi:hypothetical protein
VLVGGDDGEQQEIEKGNFLKVPALKCVLESNESTVEPLVTHTSRWTPQAMGYEGLWVGRGMLKMGSKNHQKIVKNCRKYLGLLTRAKSCYFYNLERNQSKQLLSYYWSLQARIAC